MGPLVILGKLFHHHFQGIEGMPGLRLDFLRQGQHQSDFSFQILNVVLHFIRGDEPCAICHLGQQSRSIAFTGSLLIIAIGILQSDSPDHHQEDQFIRSGPQFLGVPIGRF